MLPQQAKHNFMTSDKNCYDDRNYIIITDLLNEMVRTGAIFLGAGYCLSMSDMIRTALKHRGIDSKLVDCQATFTDIKSQNSGDVFIGFSNIINPGEIDTHVVVVTSTNPSYLIDASLSKRLPNNRLVIVEPIKFNSDNQLTLVNTTFEDDGLRVTYQQKKIQIAGYQHQMSIIDRIEMDKKINNDIQILKTLNYVGIVLSLFAVINVVGKIFGIL